MKKKQHPGRKTKPKEEKSSYQTTVYYNKQQKEKIIEMQQKYKVKKTSDLFKQAIFGKKLKVEYVDKSIEYTLIKLSVINQEFKDMLSQNRQLMDDLKTESNSITQKKEIIDIVMFNFNHLTDLKKDAEEQLEKLMKATESNLLKQSERENTEKY